MHGTCDFRRSLALLLLLNCRHCAPLTQWSNTLSVFAVPSTLLGSPSAPRRILRAPSVPVSMPQCRTAATSGPKSRGLLGTHELPLAAWTHGSSESRARGNWASCYDSHCVFGWAWLEGHATYHCHDLSLQSPGVLSLRQIYFNAPTRP